jgi:hypothetical protein
VNKYLLLTEELENFKGEIVNKPNVITVSMLTGIECLCHSVGIFPSEACNYVFSTEKPANI